MEALRNENETIFHCVFLTSGTLEMNTLYAPLPISIGACLKIYRIGFTFALWDKSCICHWATKQLLGDSQSYLIGLKPVFHLKLWGEMQKIIPLQMSYKLHEIRYPAKLRKLGKLTKLRSGGGVWGIPQHNLGGTPVKVGMHPTISWVTHQCKMGGTSV